MRAGCVWAIGLVSTIAAAQSSIDFNALGDQALGQRNYAVAESYFQQAVEEFRKLGPAYEAHLAASLLNLAATLCTEGRRTEGGRDYEEALALHRHSLGPRHIRTLVNINRLADNYMKLGEADKAQKLYSEALAIERELFPDDVQLAHSLGGLAAFHLSLGQAAEALPLAEEGLDVARRAAGEDSSDAAKMYACVAEIRRILGQPVRALPLYRKARSIYEKSFGPDDLRIAPILSQEGLILIGEGKLTLAEQALTGALRTLGSGCPACLPEIAVAENNLGVLRLRQKRYAEADQLFSHVLSLQNQYSSRPGSEAAATLQNLEIARQKEGLASQLPRSQALR